MLLADDNAISRRVARMLLESRGADVEEAENGAEALRSLARRPVDLLLLDAHMPVMGGEETVRRIRAAEPPLSATRVIALTADAMAGDRERFLAAGMDGYVAKPINPAELFIEIARVAPPRAAPQAREEAPAAAS